MQRPACRFLPELLNGSTRKMKIFLQEIRQLDLYIT